jgi:hypothetical protein
MEEKIIYRSGTIVKYFMKYVSIPVTIFILVIVKEHTKTSTYIESCIISLFILYNHHKFLVGEGVYWLVSSFPVDSTAQAETFNTFTHSYSNVCIT